MNSRVRRIVLFGFLFVPAVLHAQFYSLETKHLRLIYLSKEHEYVTPLLARCFENAFQFHSNLFHYTPSGQVTVLLQDFGDYASGGANTVPFNLIGIGIAPFNYAYETMPPLERMTMMMNHELVHIFTMDKPSPSNKFFRSLFFGKVAPIPESPPSMLYGYLTSPRWESPRWFIEGIAVFLETWMGGGLGRAQSAYDEMVFRTMVRDSAYFYDVVGLESEATKVDFQVGATSYLYGTRFVSYLALLYGPEKLIEWYSQTDGSKGNFSSDFERVYGSWLDTEWSKWIDWEHQWQRANLDSVELNPITRFRPLAHEGLGSVSRAFCDSSSGDLYVAINYPGQTAHIAAINVKTGAFKKIHDVRGAALFYVTSLAYDPASRTLFYTTDNNNWRSLYALDLATGRARMLLEDVRTGDLAFNQKDKSIWGVRHKNGVSTLVRIPYPYNDWNSIYTLDYGQDLFDIDVSPDGSMLTGALSLINAQQLLIKMDIEKLLSGDTSHEVLFDFEDFSPESFVFSPDGNFLYGNSYYTGVSNIVRYDFARKEMEWLTNTESGFFRPVPVSQDSLIAFHFSGKGFVPAMIANQSIEDVSKIRFLGATIEKRYPVLDSWHLKPPSPETINLDSIMTYSGDYSPSKAFRLASIYPVVEGYKDFPAYGLRFNIAEPTTLHRMDFTISYSPNQLLAEKERLHAAFNYQFWQWRIGATYNGADFYDLFGPTKLSRKGNSLTVEHKDYLIFHEPETMDYRISLGGYWGLERLPEFQNVPTSFDRFLSLDARLSYKNTVKSLGAVEDEGGTQWQAASHANYVSGQFIPRVYADFDYGTLLPINHSSLWFRSSTGYSFGKSAEPFANFYFGGFGNNWIDHGAIWRYREDYSFPGMELNGIGGINYAKAMLEWDLPPLRFRRFGLPKFYCNWSRLALFSSAIVTNLDREPNRRSFANAGGQVDFRLVIFSSLESTFSLGYAVAVERDQRLSKEFMISLKILQ